MAGNKFATMLHRNSHKLIVILVYTVLEWILIILLLLNSLFTYLITKFAQYFGLKKPCPWCSRIDHMLERGNNTNSYRDLVCETHATEISKLSYCSSHQRLAETQNMCMDCLAARPNHNDESVGMTRRIAFISWVSKNTTENGENILRCSCCHESLNSNLYPSYLLFKPSLGTLKYTQEGNLIVDAIEYGNNGIGCKEIRKVLDSLADYNEDGNEIGRDDDPEGQEDADEHQMLSDVGSFGLKDGVEADCSRSDSNLQCDENETNITDQESYGMNFVHLPFDDSVIEYCFGEDNSLEIINQHSERNLGSELSRLIPVELIDSSTTANHESRNSKEDVAKPVYQNGTFNSASHTEMNNEEKKSYAKVESLDIAMDCCEKTSVSSLRETKKDLVGEACEQFISLEAARTFSDDGNISIEGKKEPGELREAAHHEEEINDFELLVDQTESKDFIELTNSVTNQPQVQDSTTLPCLQEDRFSDHSNGAEITNAVESNKLGIDQTESKDFIELSDSATNQPQSQESMTLPCLQEDRSSEHGKGAEIPESPESPNDREETPIEEKGISADKNEEGINHHLSESLEPNEAEEKFPETPTSVDSVHYLHKKLLLFEKRESGTEESLDGSVVSEMDSGDLVLTVERMKTALKAERKAFSALYAELEEERSASAIAANQTMAMINRLQEEKAAMQMEALQYQRMMEEQAEYDQEALQLLNELMVKREKEKQELEKELEVYRKKVLDYEAKEKMRMMRRIKDGSIRSRASSATCSNAEDVDELSIDLNREAKDEDASSSIGNQENSNNNTPVDEVVNLQEIALDCVKQMSALDGSLAEFEEERLSILDQLKALEEKLLNLDESVFIEDANSGEQSSKYSVKGYDDSYELSTPDENGVSNGFSKDKYYPERMTMSSMAKNLLPLLDAADNETEEGLMFDENVESEYVEMEKYLTSKFDVDNKKLAIEEEVDHVYERLQALEADREFLKHCLSSIKKGDKGVDLLQEILQHLRDLRAVELRVRNMSDDPLD